MRPTLLPSLPSWSAHLPEETGLLSVGVLEVAVHAHGEVGQARRQRRQGGVDAALRPVRTKPTQVYRLSEHVCK